MKGDVTQEICAHYRREVRERGKRGAIARVAAAMGRSAKTVENLLYRSEFWKNRDRYEFDDAMAEMRREAEADMGTSGTDTSGILIHPGNTEETPEEIRRLERRIVSLTDDNRKLRTQLRHEDRQLIVLEPILEEMSDLIQPIPFVPAERRTDYGKAAFDVDAVLLLSDQHSDRVIRSEGTWGLESYDFNTFRARLWEWAKTTRAYCLRHLPRYRFRTLWVFHLGDAVNGDIHDMKRQNYWRNSLKAALATGDVQSQALTYLRDAFERIVVVCIPGNHGRTDRQIQFDHPHDNFDYLVAETMRLRTAEYEDIEVYAPESWSAHVDVRGHLCHLNHGNGVRGTWGIPWYGFERREGRVARLVGFKNQRVDYYFYGHYHTPLVRPAGQGKAIHAGAWYFTDGYSLNSMSAGNEPEQALMVFSERFGKQIQIDIRLRDEVAEAALAAGDWSPPFGTDYQILEEAGRGPMTNLPIIR